MEAEGIVDRQHLVLGDAHGRARIVVHAAGVRDQRVHEVVATALLDDDEDRELAVAVSISAAVAVASHAHRPPGI